MIGYEVHVSLSEACKILVEEWDISVNNPKADDVSTVDN